MNEVSANQLIIETIGEKLEHLSIEQLALLINKYKSGYLVENLLEEYDLNIKSTMLIREFPLVRVDKCPNCPADLGCPVASKSSKEFLYFHKEECWNCGHKPNFSLCSCVKCVELREDAKKLETIKLNNVQEFKRKQIIEQCEIYSLNTIDEIDLSLFHKMFLGTVLRLLISEHGTYIKSFETTKDFLTPTEDMTIRLLKELISVGAISPSPDSSIDSFSFDNENKLKGFFLTKVKYLINIKSDNQYSFLIERLMYPEIDIYECYEELLEVWKQLALSDCLSYLLYQMNDVGYNFSIGDTTRTTFEKLLENFSVGQIYTLIFRAVANSTRAYQSGGYTKTHAMNMVIASCRNQGERALAEKWDLKPYNRIKQLPESELTRLLFTTILKMPNQGFYMAPTLGNLQDLLLKENSM